MPWLQRIRAGLTALLAFLDEQPLWARPLILEREELTLPEATRRVRASLGEVLDAGRGQVIVGSQLTPPTSLIAELLSTAVLSLIRARMLAADPGPLTDLAPSLMDFVVEPYLGAGAASADRMRDPSLPAPALAEARILPIRAHPRVLRALRVIASTPGVSNRDVEAAVSAKDTRGREIWQVLKPLQQRGLIENTRPGGAPGDPNAWRLTAYGRRTLELVGESHATPPRSRSGDSIFTPRDVRGRAA